MASKSKVALPAFTGSTTIGELLTHYGKVVENSTRTLDVRLTCHSTLKLVAPAAQVSNDDKNVARGQMTASEVATIAKFDALCQAAARARNGNGDLVERWTITGEATKL